MDRDSNEVTTNACYSSEARSHRTFLVTTLTRQRDHPHSLPEPIQVFGIPVKPVACYKISLEG